MNPAIEHFRQSLPKVLEWINAYRTSQAAHQVRLMDAPFERLKQCFTEETLERSYYASVSVVETPPLAKLGLPEFQSFEGTGYAGITYLNIYYLEASQAQDESLHFHEMIHVIQWDELGAENFLLLYAIGLAMHGYRNSPLEEIAYNLQAEFDAGRLRGDQEPKIREHARSLFQRIGTLS